MIVIGKETIMTKNKVYFFKNGNRLVLIDFCSLLLTLATNRSFSSGQMCRVNDCAIAFEIN